MIAKNFTVRKAANWKNLLKLYNDKFANPKTQWVFRGLPNAKYKLETSLERASQRFGRSSNKLIDLEAKMIRQFKRHAGRYWENPPKDDDTLEWLALMRHFYSPTRFQDWTYSFFVALFFAVEKAEERCAVWAIDMDWLKEKVPRLFPPGADKFAEEKPPYKSGEFFEHVFCNPSPTRFVYTLNPERLNERLIVQQGLFIAPGDISTPFEKNLDAVCKTDSNPRDHIWKITINDNVNLRCEILRHLYRMNINRASLFPGLEGFAESLGTYVANPDLLGKID